MVSLPSMDASLVLVDTELWTEGCHYPRVAGVSKYHLWNRLAGPLKDCFAYRWMKHRYINYHIDEASL